MSGDRAQRAIDLLASITWYRVLGRNLAIAGALAQAWRLGYGYGRVDGIDDGQWLDEQFGRGRP